MAGSNPESRPASRKFGPYHAPYTPERSAEGSFSIDRAISLSRGEYSTSVILLPLPLYTLAVFFCPSKLGIFPCVSFVTDQHVPSSHLLF